MKSLNYVYQNQINPSRMSNIESRLFFEAAALREGHFCPSHEGF